MHYKYQVTDLRSCCTGVIEESRVWQLCLVFFLRLIFRIALIVSLIPAFLLQSVLTSKLYDSKIFKNFQKFSAPISHFFLQRRAGHVIVEMSLINLDSCRGLTGAQHMAIGWDICLLLLAGFLKFVVLISAFRRHFKHYNQTMRSRRKAFPCPRRNRRRTCNKTK